MSTDAATAATADMLTTIKLTLSSHPEFRYFVDVRVKGRQIARRFDTRVEVDAFAAEADAAARNAGFTVTIADEIPVDYDETC